MSKETKITISCTSKDKPEPVEETVRKTIDGLAANETVKLRIKGEFGGTSPWEDYILVAAVIRDKFDEQTGKQIYIFAKAGDQAAFKEAVATARRFLRGPEAKPVSLAFAHEPDPSIEDAIDEADGDEPAAPCTALVKAGGEAPLVEAETVQTGKKTKDGRKPVGFEYDEQFELSAEPPPAEVRAKLIEEIEEAEKGAASARTRMKKASAQLADAVDAGLSEAVPLADYRKAKEEWFGWSNDLVAAQDRLRSFDAALKSASAT